MHETKKTRYGTTNFDHILMEPNKLNMKLKVFRSHSYETKLKMKLSMNPQIKNRVNLKPAPNLEKKEYSIELI